MSTVKGDVALRKISGAVNVRSERGKVVAMLESDVARLEAALEAAGAPYTPGRIR